MRKIPFAFYILICFSYTAFAQSESRLDSSVKLKGTASFYARKFEGRRTASGDIFHHNKLTAACNKLPLGTRVKVTNLKNYQMVEVLINDRMAHKNRRLIDLTEAAAKKLSMLNHGLIKVEVEVIAE